MTILTTRVVGNYMGKLNTHDTYDTCDCDKKKPMTFVIMTNAAYHGDK